MRTKIICSFCGRDFDFNAIGQDMKIHNLNNPNPICEDCYKKIFGFDNIFSNSPNVEKEPLTYEEALDDIAHISLDEDDYCVYEIYEEQINTLRELIKEHKKLKKVIEFLKPHTHLASGLCEIKLVDEEVSKITPKYHNGKEIYEPRYNEFYKLFKELLEDD